MFKKNSKRLLASLLAVVMIVAALPMSALAAPAADIPEKMLNNPYLDALAYTGYGVQTQKDNGTIFKKYGYQLEGSSILSGITYGYTSSGLETDSSGRPNISAFKSGGLCCASYVSYVYFNYLPHVAGIDVSDVPRPGNYRSASSLSAAADGWVSAGLSRRISFVQNSDGSNFVPSEEIPIGSLVVFKSIEEGNIAHVALYAGYYNGQYYLTHVGNDRGPEISTIVGMSKGGYPEAVVQIVTPPVISDNGAIEVYKQDPNGKNLSGAVFTATNTATNVQYLIGPTNSSGYAKTTESIPYGNYRVVETVFPKNYRAYGQTEWNVTVSNANNGVVTVHAVNDEIPGSCKIVKTSEDGKVDGISFRVTGNGMDTTVQTKNGGQIQLDNLKPGTYTVTEQSYEKYEPQESRSVTVVSGQTATVTFNNKLKRGDLTVTKTAEDGLEAGMKFHLFGTSLSGLSVDEYAIVGSDKKAYFKDVLIGSGYVLEEVGTPDQYIVPEKQTADIEWNKVTNKSFDNDLKRGNLIVTKTAEDGLEEGICFRLHGTSYSGLPVDEYATVGADHKAYFNNILIGTGYVLEEYNTDIRYVVPEKQTADIEWNKVTNKSFDNPLKKWNLTLTKLDSETGSTAQGDGTLGGATYGIFKNGELIDTYITDHYGSFTTKYYICGDGWSWRELSSSEGYLVNPTTEKIGAEAKTYTLEYNSLAMESLETVKKGSISIIKHTDNGDTQIETPEVGAEFQIYLKAAGSFDNAKTTERDTLVCDSEGYAQSKLLPWGRYVVHQTKSWESKEMVDDFEVFISEDGEIYRFIINNHAYEALIEIVKKDAETGKIIPAAGVGFKVRNRDTGEYIVQHINYPTPMDIDVYYTDSTGRLMLPEALEYGNYEAIEQCTVYGYVLDSTPVPFTVDGTSKVVTVEKFNIPQKGTITVGKTGEVFFSVTESDSIYKPVYEVGGIAGAVYEIRAAEDIYTPDGTLRYAKGTVVDTITTTSSGFATSKALYLGKFEVQEIQAPYGMLLNSEIHTVELVYAGQEVEITETATNFYNERQRIKIDLNKIMEQDNIFGIGTNNEIFSVRFGLFTAEDLIAADGTFIPKDGFIEIVSCDENGYAVFTTDLPIGAVLYVQEIATESHYILSDTKYPVTFEYAGQDVATVSVTINNGEVIDNNIIYGTIKGLKVDRETGETIDGALFGLFRETETEYTLENALLTAESQNGGVFTFENIPKGCWKIVELKPAEGFLPNTEVYTVEVNKDEQVIEITVVNDRIPEIGTVATVDGEKEIHPTGTVTLEDVVSYKHLIPGKEYTFVGILMDKATDVPFLVNGEEVRSEVTFVPEDFTGKIIVAFTFDASVITEDTDLVVFQKLYKDGVELAEHADIEDENETVSVLVPEIGTSASVEDEKTVNATEVFTLEDVVSYSNLIPGKEYTVRGVLMDKNTGEPLLIDGEEVRSEVTFIPETADGEIIVSFEFDSKFIKVDTDIVAFEHLSYTDVELAVHADITDENQTVSVLVPEIDSQATIEGGKSVTAKGTVTVEDVVSYRNLTPGKEYTVSGVLMSKATGEPFTVNGKEIRSEVAFIPEAADGEATVTFTFNADGITTATDLVVFQTLYRDNVEIAAHTDIEAETQTITLLPPPPSVPQTGDNSKLSLWIALMALSMAGIAFTLYLGRRRKVANR